jgi:sulfide:quinone oxidoreductase
MRVIVAGGGIAALETLTGLKALAGERVDATLLALNRTFSYRPLSMATPFTFLEERTPSLDDLARGVGARFVHDGLAEVDRARRRVLTRDGDLLPYDVLVIAVGARPDRRHRDLAWSREPSALARFARIVADIEARAIRSVALVVARKAAWPVDAYELALVAARAAEAAGSGTKVSLLTAESAPLEAFGAGTAEAVGAELTRAGVELITDVEVTAPEQDDKAGRDAFSSMVARLSRGARRRRARDELVLQLSRGTSLAVDRALFLPAVHGPAPPGVSHDSEGFVPVDGHCRVSGQEDVYAAGDATLPALKHSTLASSQGTAAAEAIAAAAGADVDPRPWSATLYGILTLPPHFPGRPGSPWVREGEPVTHCLWWPPGHVAGRHLAPYLASHDPGVRPGLDWHPNGIPVAVHIGERADEARMAPAPPDEAAVRQDAIARQLLAVRRAEHEGAQVEHALEIRGEEFARHHREVVQQLQAAGYLAARRTPSHRAERP